MTTRISVVCVVLAITGIATIPLGLLLPGSSDSGTVLKVEDVQAYRSSWWAIVMVGTLLGSLNVPAQAIAVLTIVRTRGAKAATWGAALMWVGAMMETVGLAGFVSAYFYPSDPSVPHAAGVAAYQAIANDHLHLLVIQLPGHLLLTVGVVVQAVALFRSHAVPRWVPVLTLWLLVTYFTPGSHVIGLVASVPLAVASAAVAYFAWNRLHENPGTARLPTSTGAGS
jgi:hypothetical protein